MKFRPSDIVLVILAGLVLGAIVHIFVVLRVPALGDNDAFSRYALSGRDGRAELIPRHLHPGGTAKVQVPQADDLVKKSEALIGDTLAGTELENKALPGTDPAVATAVCAYDLSDGPLRVTAPASGLLQTLSIHARRGGVFYGLTERASVKDSLDVAIMTQSQLDDTLASEDEEATSSEIRVVSPTLRGLVVVRAMAPQPAMLKRAEAAVTNVTCLRQQQDE